MTDLTALKAGEARVCTTSYRDGDGYSWGSETILIIGDAAIPMGAGKQAAALAREISNRWNEHARRAAAEARESE